jgi:hypothetical protein
MSFKVHLQRFVIDRCAAKDVDNQLSKLILGVKFADGSGSNELSCAAKC